jgi:hypothetical protein
VKTVNRKSFTKSPTERKTIAPYAQPAPVAAVTPDLPSQLVSEFQKDPSNYNKLDALVNPDHFEATHKKWKELGIL